MQLPAPVDLALTRLLVYVEQPNDQEIRSFWALRRSIGVAAMTFPFVLVIGNWVVKRALGIEPSISDYYHTAMRDLFVATLCVIAICLWLYRGPQKKDDFAANFAALCAFVVALVPTTPSKASEAQTALGQVHFAAAALLFATLAYFCLFLFTRTKHSPPWKLRVYVGSGWTMIGCIAAIAVVKLFAAKAWIDRWDPVFWLEAVAILAFGASWLTKAGQEPEKPTR